MFSFFSVETVAATRIQAAWRGYVVRRDIELHTELHFAATIIQSWFRGHRVRKRVKHAMNYAKMADNDDFEDDFAMKEVDLGAFDFDEVLL